MKISRFVILVLALLGLFGCFASRSLKPAARVSALIGTWEATFTDSLMNENFTPGRSPNVTIATFVSRLSISKDTFRIEVGASSKDTGPTYKLICRYVERADTLLLFVRPIAEGHTPKITAPYLFRAWPDSLYLEALPEIIEDSPELKRPPRLPVKVGLGYPWRAWEFYVGAVGNGHSSGTFYRKLL